VSNDFDRHLQEKTENMARGLVGMNHATALEAAKLFTNTAIELGEVKATLEGAIEIIRMFKSVVKPGLPIHDRLQSFIDSAESKIEDRSPTKEGS